MLRARRRRRDKSLRDDAGGKGIRARGGVSAADDPRGGRERLRDALPHCRCGTESGFRIYNVSPFKETYRRVFSGGGVGIVEMLFRCNLLALVGGGRSPRYPQNKVMIWDDHQNRCIGELSFRSNVKAVKLRRDRVVVVLATKVYVYRFSDLKLLDQISTQTNPRGLVALCPHPACTVLACPGVNRGRVRVELYDARKSTIITAYRAGPEKGDFNSSV